MTTDVLRANLHPAHPDSLPVLNTQGHLAYLTAEGGLLIFCRKAGGERTYTALNTGDTPRDVTLPWPNGFAVDAVTLQRFWVRDDMLRLTLPPCDGVILV